MYRPKQSRKAKVGTIGTVAALHGIAIAALMTAGGFEVLVEENAPLQTIDVEIEPPPPPLIEEVEEPEPETPREEGEASAKQVESTATEIVRPDITPPIPVPSPVVAAPIANTGNDSTQGASDVDEGGTGAGGVGEGTGAGNAGSGTGGGGEGTRPKLIKRTQIVTSDYPKALRREVPRVRTVIAFRVQTNGRVSDCKINGTSGNPDIDRWTCSLAESKLRFEPAKDANGRPYVEWYGYIQAAVR